MTRPLVILLTGPPGAGKDTIADAFVKRYPEFEKRKFAEPIRKWLTFQWGIPEDQIDNRKNQICPVTSQTYRQMMIDYSEKFMKPTYGKDIFGFWMVATLHRDRPSIISDSGFVDETEVLVWQRLWRIVKFDVVREGTNFENDSRSYWDLAEVPSQTLLNNGTPLAAVSQMSLSCGLPTF